MDKNNMSDLNSASISRKSKDSDKLSPSGYFTIDCFREDGSLRWSEKINNLITNQARNYSLDVSLRNGTPEAAWYVGLTDASPTPALADTAASHAGWTENENYSEGVRQTLTLAAASGQIVTNTASQAAFSIDTNSQSLGGCFIIANNTKGGSTGVLWSVGAFTGGNKAADNGDTINVTYSVDAN